MTQDEEHLNYEYDRFIEKVEKLRNEIENMKNIRISKRSLLKKLDKILNY